MKRISRETNLKVQQLFGGIKPIKVQGVELPFINEFSESAGQESRLLAAHSLLLIAPKYIIEPLAFGSVIAYVLYAATNGESLVSLLPTLGLMVMAAYRMLPNIQSLYNSASTFTSNGHIVEEIIDELEMVSDANSIKALQRAKPLRRIPWGDCIQMKKLCFRYPGSDRNVIDDLSLKIPKNSSIAFVGTTGCGKSTLVDLVLGLHAPSSGSLQIDNQALTRENAREWRSGVGYVPQEIFLLDDTVIANVALGVRSEDVDFGLIERVCAAAQIRQFIEMELPEKWMTKVGERGVRLSGGQRQRIGLARALYRQPDLLVLDEATSALDHVTEASVMQAIRGLNGELTMIIVAHRLSTIEWCDQVVSLQSPVSFVAE